MFSEELAGNASKKRAEQNRARRRQFKQQQEKKAAPKPVASTAPSNDQAGPSNAADTAPTVSTTAAAPRVTPPSTNQQLSAVEKADQQRKLRAQALVLQKSASRIQCVYRAYMSNLNARKQVKFLLSQRLADLSTLRNLLRQKTNVTYAPPPATTTALVQQLLFLTRSVTVCGRPTCIQIRSAAELQLLQHVLECAVIPGIETTDDNLFPFAVWMQSSHGSFRMEELIRLALVSVRSSSLSDTASKTVFKFLRLLLGLDSAASESAPRQMMVTHTRSLLLSKKSVIFEVPVTSKVVPHARRVANSLDFIGALRHYLLFEVAGPHPIPPNAKDLRESCVPTSGRTRGGDWLHAIVEAVWATPVESDRRALQGRLVTDILTIPLLTWKVSPESIADFVHVSKISSARPPLVVLLQSFADEHSSALQAGEIGSLLPSADVPLTACPSTTTQCMLANLIQLGRLCPAITGADAAKVEYAVSSVFFDFLATLVDVVPLGTFSSRDSAVEWITDGNGHHKPVVLSIVIIDQCKVLLMDSFVRRLFACAIDMAALDTERVLATKNEKDEKHEKDLLEGGVSSAATLAAKEARMDRNRSFWNSSKWARQLTKGVTGLLSGGGGNEKKSASKNSDGGEGMLMNTSSVSRKLAGGAHDRSSTSAVLETPSESSSFLGRKEYSPDLFFALCRVFSVVLARWGGGGNSDAVRKVTGDRTKGEVATSAPEPCALALLNVLCFSTPIIKATWGLIQSDEAVITDVYNVIDSDKGGDAVRTLKVRPSFAPAGKRGRRSKNDGATLLYLFSCTLAHSLIITDDVEIHDMDRPVPIHQLRRCIQVLKKLLYRACVVDNRSTSIKSNYFGLALITSASRTMRDLYDRSSRRPLCTPKLWLVKDLLEKELRSCKRYDDYQSLLSAPVLRVCPFLVSFKRRLQLFERIITTNRVQIQGENSQNPFHTNPLKPGIPVRITRGRILEDGLATMNNLGPNMRQRIAVQYYNAAGTRESGIDAGGLFKEFWTDLSEVAFNENYALFRVTDGAGNCLYPNPSSSAAHGSQHIVLFEFLGRILGKALYEGITIHPRFAHFFLSFLRGDYNFLHMLPDLSTIDPQLYNNLMFLKTYDGDAEDLCLSFTITVNEFGGTREIPLMPNGANIDVTNANKQRYISLVSKYYVVDRVREQSEAFTRGLWEVIDRSWLRLFNEPELQVLISGASDGKIDVDDMRANAKYVGGYTGIDRTVNRFWNVMASLDSKQQASLLRFVTSCERPPPLGFGSMIPPFTIQRVGILRDGDKLPASSTCFNTLKLPTYSSEKVMKQRLIYAIESGAGFELS